MDEQRRRRYLEAMGIPLLAGRDISEGDDHESPNVVVINDVMALSLEVAVPQMGHAEGGARCFMHMHGEP